MLKILFVLLLLAPSGSWLFVDDLQAYRQGDAVAVSWHVTEFEVIDSCRLLRNGESVAEFESAGDFIYLDDYQGECRYQVQVTILGDELEPTGPVLTLWRAFVPFVSNYRH